MSAKSLIWLGFFLGSTLGSFVPLLWRAGPFSFSGIFLSAAGGVIGIWAGYKLGSGL